MAIHYLDVDDEVTTAVARLRASIEPHVALVLPPGSRVATSRINFRLLAREAALRDRRLAIVAPEAAVRSVALAAGVPAYATVGAYEAAVAEEAEQEERERRRGGATQRRSAEGQARRDEIQRGATSPVPETGEIAREPRGAAEGDAPRPGGAPDQAPAAGGTAASIVPVAPAGPRGTDTEADRRPGAGTKPGPGTTPGAGRGATGGARGAPSPGPALGTVTAAGGGAGPAAGTGPRSAGALPVVKKGVDSKPRRRRRWLVPLAVLVVLVIAAGGAAYVLLPSATIVVTPVGVVEGPIQLQVTADPTATSVDQASLVIPARQISIPLSVSGTFPATGQKITETASTGSVTFVSNDTIDPVTIPAGTTVATGDGVQFLTSTTIVTPRATVSGTTITPGTASTGVKAVAPGTGGNVGAHAITVVPTRLQAFQVAVDNPAPTSGGTRTVTKVISQQDYDAAVKQLTTKLQAQLPQAAASPSAAPSGSTVIPATLSHGDVVTAPASDGLVGVAKPTFQLTATETASVLAVSEQPLSGLAADYLQTHVPSGWSLFPDSVQTSVSDPVVQGGQVLFTVTAQAERWEPLDAASLLAQVKGRTVAQARATLSQYGEVSISTWPSYVKTIPTLDARVSLTVAPPKRAGS